MYWKHEYIVLLICCSIMTACAQPNKESPPKSYVAYKALEPIEIDGHEKDESWNKVDWSDPFIDIEGIEKPTYSTHVKMLWDETYFYILAKIEEPHVWASLKQRDTIIFYNNDFEVFVDPDGDTHNYYELEMNAINTIWDLFISKPYREDNVVLNDWTVNGLKTAVKIDGTLNDPNDIDKGWVAEIAIPWSVYKKSYFENNIPADKFWRVNFSRVNWDFQITDGKYERKKGTDGKYLHEYNWVWSPIGVINMHEPERWGYVYFSTTKAGGHTEFAIPKDEKVKWELYRLHKAQKEYYRANSAFASSLKDLKIPEKVIEGETLMPILENHSTGYNITIKSPFSGKQLIIKEYGKFLLR